MRLAESVDAALPGSTEPAAVLALAYADAIDEASHVPLALAEALDLLRTAAAITDAGEEDGGDRASRAFRQVEAAVATVTVLDKLGPKLLAALDALLVTPKAKAAITGRLESAGQPDSPLDELRNRHDSRRLRAAG